MCCRFSHAGGTANALQNQRGFPDGRLSVDDETFLDVVMVVKADLLQQAPAAAAGCPAVCLPVTIVVAEAVVDNGLRNRPATSTTGGLGPSGTDREIGTHRHRLPAVKTAKGRWGRASIGRF